MNKNLLVYDASAGSGKTFKLSEKYSDYLLEEFNRGNKEAYRFVMAVTFTNKATLEMKSRIINLLSKRSKGIFDDGERKLNPKEIADSANILKLLVHDYTMFRVSTIDRFFQRVLKAFAVEMGSRSSFDTTLDKDPAIEAAMDNLYSKLDTDEKLRSMIERISLARINEEQYWNWRDNLLAICNRVLDSKYQNYKNSSDNSDGIDDLEQFFECQMDELNKNFVKQVADLYDNVVKEASKMDLRHLNGTKDLRKLLEDRLAGEKQFIDRNNNTILRWYPDILDTWRTDPEQLNRNGTSDDIDEIDTRVGEYIDRIKELFVNNYAKYKTLKLIKLNIRESSLLDFVNKELDEYLSREQLILLSRTPKILADLIDGSDTPFVYDKIGASIDHYLLDEFQDTSDVQWDNFRPLLEESLSRNEGSESNGLESMLVGDVKQSIYRFRDGKWNLFKNIGVNVFTDNCKKEFLDVNHRSLKNIVEFNNFLFSTVEKDKWLDNSDSARSGALVEMFIKNLFNNTEEKDLCNTIASIYKKSAQKVKPKFNVKDCSKGVVHVISCNFDEEKAGITKNDFILQDMVKRIIFLTKEKGYCPKDIAVLSETNYQCGIVANYLVNNGISIVSGDSLKLDSCKVVSLIIEILRKLVNPKDKGLEALSRLYGNNLMNLDHLDFSTYNGKKFIVEIRSCNTLYQMCKKILRTFFVKPEDGDIAFIKAFLDKTLDYSVTNGTSIPDFLKWWDLLKDKFYIPEPSSSQAVQIMTMHKAKGLGFKVVFIPFLKDDMITYKTFPEVEKVWFALDKDKIGYEGPLLIPFTKGLEESLYKDEFYKELMERSIDNLNLAYVTFTRAKERLFIYAKENKTNDGDITSISAALNDLVPAIDKGVLDFNTVVENLDGEEVITDFVLGNDLEDKYVDPDEEKKKKEEAEKKEVTTPIVMEASMIMQEPAEIRLRTTYEDENTRKGVLYHELLSYIDEEGNTEGNIEKKVARAVEKFLRKNPGALQDSDAKSLEKEVLGMIASAKAKGYGWFDEGKKILCEQSIVSQEGKNLRPDRIILPAEGKDWAEVVDYKFGEYENDSDLHKKYLDQVRKYMNLLKDMGYTDVKGYLWYVFDDDVVPV